MALGLEVLSLHMKFGIPKRDGSRDLQNVVTVGFDRQSNFGDFLNINESVSYVDVVF